MRPLIRSICVLLAALVAIGTVPPSVSALTIAEEEELSREFMKLVRAQFPLIQDPMIADYVNGIGYRILKHVPPQPFTYHFYVLDEHVYNAFATPAGHIFINRGLVTAMDSEEELAGILAHEIAHVTARHISDKIERSKATSLAALAGVVAGAFLGIAGAGSAAANAMTFGGLAASQTLALSYSRQDEVQADRLGLIYLSDSGYSAKGLLVSLQKIRSRQWFGSVPDYLSTHPASEDRMAYIDAWIEKTEESGEASPPEADSARFRMVRTRLLALYGDEAPARSEFENRLAVNADDLLGHYGMGLLLDRTGHAKDALVHLKRAMARRPLDPYILKDIGKLHVEQGDYAEALRVLENAENLTPFDPERSYYLGMAQLHTGQTAKATRTMEYLISVAPGYAQAYYALGEIYGKQGQMPSAHYYLGLYYRQKGDMRNARFHLQRSLKSTADPKRRQEIEAILNGIGPPRKPA